jgi:hypothetical protein
LLAIRSNAVSRHAAAGSRPIRHREFDIGDASRRALLARNGKRFVETSVASTSRAAARARARARSRRTGPRSSTADPIDRQPRERELDERLGLGRGISTAGVTRSGNPQNSRTPVR